MSRSPLATLRGVLASVLLAANTLFWCVPLFLLALLKFLLPLTPVQRLLRAVMHWIAESWIAVNTVWMAGIRWDVEGLERFDRQHSYLITSNHQSWVDILVLQRLFNRKIPMLKFFIKHELIYVPVMGLAWWALDFPFMRRHSEAQLKRNPALREQDLARSTASLEGALRSRSARGMWGEVELARVLEASGMMRHVDFSEQRTIGALVQRRRGQNRDPSGRQGGRRQQTLQGLGCGLPVQGLGFQQARKVERVMLE